MSNNIYNDEVYEQYNEVFKWIHELMNTMDYGLDYILNKLRGQDYTHTYIMLIDEINAVKAIEDAVLPSISNIYYESDGYINRICESIQKLREAIYQLVLVYDTETEYEAVTIMIEVVIPAFNSWRNEMNAILIN